MSRNPDQIASPPSTYDADFIIAQINVIKDTLNIIRKRGQPKKENTEEAQHASKIKRRRGRPRKHDIITQHAKYAAQQITIKPSHDYNNRTITGMESHHEYNKLKKFMESSPDSKQSNTGVKSPHDSTTINSKAQKAWHNNKPSHLVFKTTNFAKHQGQRLIIATITAYAANTKRQVNTFQTGNMTSYKTR